MRFGLHYAIPCSENQSALQRYRDTIEQAVAAESLGFESVWPVEQHFNPRFSALPCPIVLLSAIAERTRTLRLGTAIVQLPLAHPLRAAEELATLDVISQGRAEFGVGRGSNPSHFAGFGVELGDSRARMEEGLALLRAAFRHERFSFEGRFFRAENASLIPRPVQQPHPPLRVAANSIESAELAGREGLPILAALHINPRPQLRALLETYHRARAAAGRPAASADDVSLIVPLYVASSRGDVEREVAPSIAHVARVLAAAAAPLLARCTSEAERRRLEGLLAHLGAMTYDGANDGLGIFDEPEPAAERIAQLCADFAVGRVIAWFNMGGLVPHPRVLRSMELFADRVLPRFAA